MTRHVAHLDNDDDDHEYQTVRPEWICRRLCIHRHTLTRIIAGDPSFPKSLTLPGGVKRYEKEAVLKWMETLKQNER